MNRILCSNRLIFLILIFIGCSHLKEVIQAYQQTDYRKAVRLSRDAVRKDSTDTGAWLYLAKSSFALNKMKQGLNALARIRSLDPGSRKHRRELSMIYLNLGEKAVKNEQYQQAIRYYLAAESRDPKNRALMQRTAEVAFEAGWLNAAKTRYEKIVDLSRDPNDVLQRLNLIESRIQFAQIEYEKGLEAYEEDNYEKASKHLQSTVKVHSDYFEAEYLFCMAKGKMLCGKGSGKASLEAASLFKRASELKPHLADPYYWTGRAYEIHNQHKSMGKAVFAYHQALQIEPDGQYASYCRKKIMSLSKRKKKLDAFWNGEKK